jgi:molybdenum cofactor cytidylyltransferase
MQHVLENGLSILQNTVERYTDVFENVSVVVQAGDSVLRNMLADQPVEIVENSNAQSGLSQSIVAGVQSLSNEYGCLIGLGDMPFVSRETLKSMHQQMQKGVANRIIAPVMNDRIGNPVAFGSAYREALLSLIGDEGAKSIVQKNMDSVVKVEVKDNGIFRDIDTLQDLLKNQLI